MSHPRHQNNLQSPLRVILPLPQERKDVGCWRYLILASFMTTKTHGLGLACLGKSRVRLQKMLQWVVLCTLNSPFITEEKKLRKIEKSRKLYIFLVMKYSNYWNNTLMSLSNISFWMSQCVEVACLELKVFSNSQVRQVVTWQITALLIIIKMFLGLRPYKKDPSIRSQNSNKNTVRWFQASFQKSFRGASDLVVTLGGHTSSTK